MGPIAFFNDFKLTTSPGKLSEVLSHAHLVSLMYKLITSSEGSDALSIGFDHSSGRRRDEMTKNKNVKGKFHLRIMLSDVFGFAEHQENATCGVGYKLPLARNKC